MNWRMAALVIVALLLLGLGLGVYATSCHAGHVMTSATVQAEANHVAAVAAAAQGAVHDQLASSQDQTVQAASAEVARLRAQLAAIQRHPVPVPAAPVGPGADAGEVADHVPGPVADPEKAAMGDLIQGLTKENDALKAEVHTLTLARDSWKTAYTQSAEESAKLRIALAASEGVAKGQLWKGRIQGLVVGFGTGYAAGKLIH